MEGVAVETAAEVAGFEDGDDELLEEKCGWLLKGRKQKKRFVALQASRISWSVSDKTGDVTLKSLPLVDCEVHSVNSTTFSLKHGDKVVEFSAKDAPDTEKWIEIISRNIAKFVFCKVVSHPDKSYIEGSTQYKHMVDIYTPAAASGIGPPLPVVIHVHGGGWKRGDRKRIFYGAPFMAQGYASSGFVSVAVSYRLGVPHPAAINDVSRAVVWVRDNISRFGGDPTRIFMSGHSAGAHLVTLAVTEPVYLLQAGADTSLIKGVVSISGIYSIRNPMAPDGKCSWRNWIFMQAYSKLIFGKNPADLEAASPICKAVDPATLPPILLVNAASDLGLELDGQRMHSKLVAAAANCKYEIIPGTNHATVTRSLDTLATGVAFIKRVLTSLEK